MVKWILASIILATAYLTAISHTVQGAFFITSSLYRLGGIVTIWLLIISVPNNKCNI